MKSACVGILSINELKNARWNTEIRISLLAIIHNISDLLLLLMIMKKDG